MKLIGITPRILLEENVEKQFVNTRYVKPLIERNFNVIMLTLDNPNIEAVLNLCDGFVITGGFDIDPTFFNEVNEGLSKNCNIALDTLDKAIVEHAYQYQKPLLGICRGHQAINVFLGGSLHQDIGDSHRKIRFDHEVKTIKNRLLDFNNPIIVNSYHHQAVKDVAKDLEVIAWHLDGTVEALIHKNLPIIGLQWHPEMIADTKESKIIFDKFAELMNK